jgi:L-rhamnose mutarotase
VRRFGWVVKLRPEKAEEYVALHAEPWPGVLEGIRASGIRNYSIFLRDGLLFGYFEYVGDDFEADMAAAAADAVSQEWWKLTGPCQEPLDSAAPGELWVQAAEIFHAD